MKPQAPVDPRTGIEAARFGLYIHFPYCLSKCPYCDFASTAAKHIPDARYTEAILGELELRIASHGLAGRELTSIFIGGGTPSLWAAGSVGRVLEWVSQRFSVPRSCEISLEANPGAADAERFASYRAAGVNRLSMGVQSFEVTTLTALGRAHDGATAERAFETARNAGFTNISMDFIYGVHGQTESQVEADARRAASWKPEHLSAYALTLDKASLAEEVPLARQLQRKEVALPPDETVVRMQRSVDEVFRAAGLHRYEISNYARPGFHSRHNALYWTGGEYLAVGAGATGHLKDPSPLRYSNHRSADRYLAEALNGQQPEAQREMLNPLELFEERVAMGLRLVSGVDLAAVCADFGQEFAPREQTVRHLISAGLAAWVDGRLALTPSGFDVALGNQRSIDVGSHRGNEWMAPVGDFVVSDREPPSARLSP